MENIEFKWAIAHCIKLCILPYKNRRRKIYFRMKPTNLKLNIIVGNNTQQHIRSKQSKIQKSNDKHTIRRSNPVYIMFQRYELSYANGSVTMCLKW